MTSVREEAKCSKEHEQQKRRILDPTGSNSLTDGILLHGCSAGMDEGGNFDFSAVFDTLIREIL